MAVDFSLYSLLPALPSGLLGTDVVVIGRGGTLMYQGTVADFVAYLTSEKIGYTPATPGNWSTPPPDDVKEALDALAAAANPPGEYSYIDDATGARTLQLTDRSTTLAPKILRAKHSSLNEITVPPNSSVAFPIGSQINILHDTNSTLEIIQGSGVTVRPPKGGTRFSAGEGTMLCLLKLATDTWQLAGTTTAA
jgi:hypothetical protein